MPTKARSSRTGRPAGGKQPRVKAKLWVLWEPPAKTLLFVVIGSVFATAGLMAIRYSNAEPTDQRSPSSTSLVWEDQPAAPVGSVVSETNSRGVMPHWRTATRYIYGGGTIKVVKDDTKVKALEFFGSANKSRDDAYGQNQRAEQVADVGLRKGSTYWFGFDLLVAPGSGVASGRQAVWQILPQPDKSPAKLWLAVNSNQEGLAVETDRLSLPLGPVPDSLWSRLVVGVHITDNDESWLEVWRDGKQVVSRQTIVGGAVAKSANSGLMSAGIYRSPQPWDLTVRMANLKIGSSRDIVL